MIRGRIEVVVETHKLEPCPLYREKEYQNKETEAWSYTYVKNMQLGMRREKLQCFI